MEDAVAGNDEPAEHEAGDGSAVGDVPEPRSKEIGGRTGPDPTRYGDWEKAGRCIDF